MTPATVTITAINPALALLPAKMDSAEARIMLLAIALQESDLRYRKQWPRGPARGFWQFERGGGVVGVLGHMASKHYAEAVCEELVYQPKSLEIHQALEHNDVLAAAFARLLLWTHPDLLPQRKDHALAWRQYLAIWRPGKPREEIWARNYSRACAFV